MTQPENTTADPPGAPAREDAGVWSRLMHAVGDRLNPILVKETRQALKSKQFTLWFVLLLIACWVTTLGAVAIIGPSIYYVSAGGYLLFAYYVILALPLIVVAPFSAYRSLSSEHEENTRDLLEVSSLTPRQVVNGKLGSALLQIVVYLSALAPCIAFTYLLRGVELTLIALLLVYAVLASLGLSVVGLVLAAATRQRYAQVVISVAFAGGLFLCFAGLLTLANGFRTSDPSFLRSPGFWWGNLAVFSLFATTFVLAYTAAVSLTMFASANRSTPLRVAAFLQHAAFIGWIAGAVAALGPPNGRELLYFFLVGVVYWFVAGAIMTGESPSLSMRVRRSLPQSWLGRAVGTWFNPGGGSGYVFAVTNLATLAVLAACAAILRGSGSVPAVKAIGLLAAYAALYLGLGRLAIVALRRVATVSPLGAFLVQLLLVLGGSGLPYVVQTVSERVRVVNNAWLTATSPPWNVPRVLGGQLNAADETTLLIAVGAAALAVFLVNLVLAGREARQLRVAAPQRVVEDERELHPVPEPQATNPWGDRPEAAPDGAT